MPEYAAGRQSEDGDDEGAETRYAQVPDLADHLMWQVHLSQLSARDLAIAHAIVEALDEDGYLAESDDAIIAAVAPEHRVNAHEVAAVRHFVQQLDPVGVASRDLRECLTVQLQHFDGRCADAGLAHRGHAPGISWRAMIVRLARDLRGHRRRTRPRGHHDPPTVAQAGARFSAVAAGHVVPDVYAYKRHGRWDVSLNPGSRSQAARQRPLCQSVASLRPR
ncbi:MAG: hypothetical protein IPO66_19365 [Rhodanobacteraceae bacterium]|nr:hypothetical protein [Rhodanobacteraceae bacterium]